MLDCPDTKISSFQQLKVQRNPCLFLWHFRSACGLSVENKCIKSRSFPNTNTVTYVHMCLLCFWYFSWVFSKFYIQYSRSHFPLSSLGLRWHYGTSKGQAGITHGGSIWGFLAPRWKISAHMGSPCPLRWICGRIAAGYRCASISFQIWSSGI